MSIYSERRQGLQHSHDEIGSRGTTTMKFELYIIYRVDQKSKPDNFCNNFVYCHPIFIIFGTNTL